MNQWLKSCLGVVIAAGAAVGNGTALAGSALSGVSSGSINGVPASLPAPWQLVSGFLIGPGANLNGADLRGASFEGANLENAILTDAKTEGTNFDAAIMPNGKRQQ